MGVSTQTARVRVQQATTPKINHVTVGTTEVSFVLESNLKILTIHNPGNEVIKYSWESGGTGASTDEFITLVAGSARGIDDIDFSGTIYLLASAASQTVEIEQWV